MKSRIENPLISQSSISLVIRQWPSVISHLKRRLTVLVAWHQDERASDRDGVGVGAPCFTIQPGSEGISRSIEDVDAAHDRCIGVVDERNLSRPSARNGKLRDEQGRRATN